MESFLIQAVEEPENEQSAQLEDNIDEEFLLLAVEEAATDQFLLEAAEEFL